MLMTINDLIAIFLKQNNIDYALSYCDGNQVTIIQGSKQEVLEWNKQQIRWPRANTTFWFKGCVVDYKINWFATNIDLAPAFERIHDENHAG